MANTYKNIVITPNRDTAANVVPEIRFAGGDANTNTDIYLRTYTTSNGTLSFEGSAGQLLSITNDLSNVIFSVNDISGIPSLEIDANGDITMAEFDGKVFIGPKANVLAPYTTTKLLVGDTAYLNDVKMGVENAANTGRSEIYVGMPNRLGGEIYGGVVVNGYVNTVNFFSNKDTTFLSGENYSERMRIDANGNIGIGANSINPVEWNSANTRILKIRANPNDYAVLQLENSNGSGRIWLSSNTGNSDTTTYLWADDNVPLVIRSGDFLAIRSGGAAVDDIVISSNGKVGIGDSPSFGRDEMLFLLEPTVLSNVPNSRMNLFSSAAYSTNQDRIRHSIRRFEEGNDWISAVHRIGRVVDITPMGYIQFGGGLGGIQTPNTGIISFGEERANTEFMRIDHTGNVLIGRANSTVGLGVKLDVDGGINAASLLVNGAPIESGITTGKAIAMAIVFG